MNLNRLIINTLVFLLVMVSGSGYTQPVILNKGSRIYLQRIGIEEHKNQNPLGQQIIREYATALATNPVNLNTSFQCEIARESTIAANGETTFRFRIVNGDIRGNDSLRGFDISDVLMPSVFNATILISNSSGDTLLLENQRGLRLSRGSSAHVRFQVDLPPQTDTVWFEVKDLFFFHERQNVQQLIGRIQKIADYYAADYLLKNIQGQFVDLNCRQYDLLPQCFLTLLEIDRVLQHIGKANFAEHLSLGISDPVGLQRRFDIASNTYTYLMREFNNTLRRTNRIYLTQTEELLVLRYIDGITRHINDNPAPGFAAAPFINQLSSITYSGKEFEQKADYFRQIAARINPELPAGESSVILLTQVYNAMLSKAQEYIDAVEFNKAVVLLENAGRFCEAFHEIECDDNAFFLLSKAKHGLFGFYLTVAERAIEMQRPDIATSYVFLGREYQKNNRNLIIHDGEVTIMLIKLFDAWVFEATKYNSRNYYDSAMLMINRAIQPDIGITPSAAWQTQKAIALNGILVGRLSDFRKALDSQPLSVTENTYHNLTRFIKEDMRGVELNMNNDAVLRSLQNKFVMQLVKAASSDISDEYFEESMRKLLLIRSMMGDRRNEFSQQVDSLSMIAGREVIRIMLSETVVFINQGKTDEGFDHYSKALQRSIEYGLDKDEITKTRLDEIYDAYLAIKCVQLQSRLDQVLIQAERQAALQLYSVASDTVNAVLKNAMAHQACRFSLDNARKFIEKYQHPADFQRSVQLADRAMQQNDFLACLRHIEHAELLFNQHELRKSGIEPFSMITYANKHKNTTLNWFVARRYVQLLKFEQALTMLEILKQSGISSSESAELQQELGTLMGNRDKQMVSFFQSFSKPKEYTGGDSWYKPFNRAYRRGLGFRFPWLF